MSRPIVFLDTETTSLRPDREAWEVAIIRRDGEGFTEFECFVGDLDLLNADPKSLLVGRF